MVSDTPKNSLLLPERHPQGNLFVCDVADAVLKDDMASMEYPFFSLSKNPENRIRRYEHGDRWLEVHPSSKGLATIYDKDILIYCISQLIAKMNDGVTPSPHVRIVAKDLLVFINRTTGGKDYEALKDALHRLDGTRIRTNVKTGGEEVHKGFGLIDSFEIKRSEKTGRILELAVNLSEWVFRSIAAKEILTLHKDYFRLKKSIERRVYEIARKHCGRQETWRISLEMLKLKCGSRTSLKGFRHDMRTLIKGDHLPDYSVSMTDNDFIVFTNRALQKAEYEKQAADPGLPPLDPEAYHDARTVAPGYDIYWLEQEWRRFWADSGKPVLANPVAAFIAFCRSRYERCPSP